MMEFNVFQGKKNFNEIVLIFFFLNFNCLASVSLMNLVMGALTAKVFIDMRINVALVFVIALWHKYTVRLEITNF